VYSLRSTFFIIDLLVLVSLCISPSRVILPYRIIHLVAIYKNFISLLLSLNQKEKMASYSPPLTTYLILEPHRVVRVGLGCAMWHKFARGFIIDVLSTEIFSFFYISVRLPAVVNFVYGWVSKTWLFHPLRFLASHIAVCCLMLLTIVVPINGTCMFHMKS
jgi:hypothetical protein